VTYGRRPDELEPAGTGPLGSPERYFLAVGITVFAILSQYFLPQSVGAVRPVYESFEGALFVTYGIPILAFLFLVGLRPLDRFATRMGASFAPALAWYGALTVLGIAVLIVLGIIYAAFDPSALKLLSRTNPVLAGADSDPWLWVAFSFAVGAIEEAIFRGWIFGYWIARGSRNLGWHAVWTSALFASMHLYYGATYLAAAPFSYELLFFTGLAFALAVRASRGNLVWVALLHGATDATAFLSIVSVDAADAIHYGIVFVGFGLAIILYLRSVASADSPASNPPSGPATPWVPTVGLPPPAPWGLPRAVSVVPPPVPPAPLPPSKPPPPPE
jgi:membrane protease YdiL (CAAX protease family)